jgi:hypothetical protein
MYGVLFGAWLGAFLLKVLRFLGIAIVIGAVAGLLWWIVR